MLQLLHYGYLIHCYVITKSHEKHVGGLFFGYGSPVTGDTYLWKTIIVKTRSEMKFVILVSSSSIFGLLYQ